MSGSGKSATGEKRRRPKNLGATVSGILKYLKRSRAALAAALFLVGVSSLSGVTGTYFLKWIIDDRLLPLVGTSPTFEAFLPLIKTLSALAAVYLVGTAASYGFSRIMLGVSENTLNYIRNDLFSHMQDLPVSFFDAREHGELMSRLTNDADALRECINQSFVQIVYSAITVTATFAVMLRLSPILTAAVAVFALFVVGIIKFLGAKSARLFREQQKRAGEANGYVEEYISGQRAVKLFCREDKTKEDFREITEKLRAAATDANSYASVIMPVIGNLSYVCYAAVAALGSVLIISVDKNSFFALTVGGLFSFITYSKQFFQPVTRIAQQSNNILIALAGAERIFEIMKVPAEEDEGKVVLVNVRKNPDGSLEESGEKTGTRAWKIPRESGGFDYRECRGDVRFRDVSFGYDRGTEVLKKASLRLVPGKKTAFVGATGAGKTTIANLITRFYDVGEGEITFDGINVKDIKKESLRRCTATVPQDARLFTGTVAENIAYGRLDATREEIIEAAKLANADSFISRLPGGYDAKIKGDGDNLSQGQRQLLTIARAAAAEPATLVLDEATSSVDVRTEKLIVKGMEKLMEGRSAFIIAHRLSTVRGADEIATLENGEIIERGTHEELMAGKGRYYEYYTGQTKLD